PRRGPSVMRPLLPRGVGPGGADRPPRAEGNCRPLTVGQMWSGGEAFSSTVFFIGMVHFAKRVRSIEASPTVHIGDLIAEMKGRGEKVLSLAIGEPDFPTPAHIVDAAKKALDADFTKYTPAPGIRELRQAVAEKGK